MDEAKDLWMTALLKAMEDYDEYDPELLKEMNIDWVDIIKKMQEDDKDGQET